MTAHPPRVRWHVETYDPTAAEWSALRPLRTRQSAVEARARATDRRPNWPDGTPVQRRIVLETTTFEDMDADTHLARFPKAGFILSCVGGQDLAVIPGAMPDGRPALRFGVGSSDTGHAEALVPLELLEEVIAGQRDTARQAGGPAAALAGAPITAEQLAWAQANLPQGARVTAEALRSADYPLCGHGECNPTECFVDFA